jgi:hypothetical protein
MQPLEIIHESTWHHMEKVTAVMGINKRRTQHHYLLVFGQLQAAFSNNTFNKSD